MPEYTERQGQYLAFVYYYTKLNGRPPAEADIGRYFRVAPPTVHQMILTLERRGFIEQGAGAEPDDPGETITGPASRPGVRA